MATDCVRADCAEPMLAVVQVSPDEQEALCLTHANETLLSLRELEPRQIPTVVREHPRARR